MELFRKQELITLLTQKGATEPCPRCRNPQFELLGEVSIPFEEEGNSPFRPLGPKHSAIPVIILACNNCGYITYHAEAILNPEPKLLLGRMGNVGR
jgi:hypothetical protein